jgi:hypothetical protein
VNDAELIAAIRDNSDLDDPEEVERAAHATLTVLGLRLARIEPIDLGSQQPTSLGRSLAAVGDNEWENMLAALPADYTDLVVIGPDQ